MPILVLLIMLVGARTAAAQTPAEADLRRLETELFQAVTARDSAALERLLAADYVLRGNPDIPRDEWVKNAIALCWGESQIDNFQVRAFDDTAVASFLLTFDRDPTTCQPATLRSLVTDVWQRRDGEWRLAVRHSAAPGTGQGIASQFGQAPSRPPSLELTGELSFVSTGGNASTRTIGLSADAIHRGRRTTTTGEVAFVRSQAEGVENARSLSAQARQGWRLSPRLEGFVRGEYLRDRFAGIAHLGTAEGGLSYTPRGAPHAFRLDIGAGLTQEARLTADDRRFASATGAASYRYTQAPISELLIETSATADLQQSRNWRASGGASLLLSVNQVVSARFGYTVRYLNEPSPGFGTTDTRLFAALVFGYKRAAQP